ncbi:flagellar basal body P-ring formation chaperone FlgA [Mangrovicella endophytica]|uniref:flagellar basal body P-ring formation chaperone FlgA n=1 Tax=Mangrovicella endophytica TaxID=2066697 RepID=UPI001FE161C3|nr:flagellar basal body P-ring formation chaperone FlgA [Mangrovicella endophytica]
MHAAIRAIAAGVLAGALLGPIAARAADIELPTPQAVIYPGQSVLDKGVGSKRFRIPGERLTAYAIEEAMLNGKVARRTLLPNKPILLSDLKNPDIVKAGVGTTLVYRDGGLIITGPATPLQSGGEGETIRVRNSDSGIVVTGTVAADGTIEVSAR